MINVYLLKKAVHPIFLWVMTILMLTAWVPHDPAEHQYADLVENCEMDGETEEKENNEEVKEKENLFLHEAHYSAAIGSLSNPFQYIIHSPVGYLADIPTPPPEIV